MKDSDLGLLQINSDFKYTPNQTSKSTIKLPVALSHVFIWSRIMSNIQELLVLTKFYVNQRFFSLTTHDAVKIQRKSF